MGIQNVVLKLFADANLDGIADNATAVRTVSTNANGMYAMASLTPGSYVIVQTQPSGWVTVDDYDASNDNDLVSNASGLDNLIPVTLLTSEIDSMNNFIEAGQPASISGHVFTDDDADMFPDEGEGMDSIVVKLYLDVNADGIADSNTALDSTLTNSEGSYLFDSMSVGNFVLIEINRQDYLSLYDVDASNDGDVVPNSNTNNDTIPVTLTNGEQDGQNFFIDGIVCPLIVNTSADSGYGSFRYNVECAEPGDTIRFHVVMSGDIVNITSTPIILDKNLTILSMLSPTVEITSSVNGLFDIVNGVAVEFRDLNVVNGDAAGSAGAAFDNSGNLTLHNILVIKNPLYPSVEYLIRNNPGSILTLSGDCRIQF
jgi:hypothetical protein